MKNESFNKEVNRLINQQYKDSSEKDPLETLKPLFSRIINTNDREHTVTVIKKLQRIFSISMDTFDEEIQPSKDLNDSLLNDSSDEMNKNYSMFIPYEKRKNAQKIINTYRLSFFTDERILKILNELLSYTYAQYDVLVILWQASFLKECCVMISRHIDIIRIITHNKNNDKIMRVCMFIILNILNNKVFISLVKCNEIMAEVERILNYVRDCDKVRSDGKKERNIKHNEQNVGRDEEYISALKHVQVLLSGKLVSTTSINNYLTELFSGKLEKTPYHFQETFWSLNAQVINDNKIIILRALRKYLLDNEMDRIAVTSKLVAANDLYQVISILPADDESIKLLNIKNILFSLADTLSDELRFWVLKSLSVIIFNEWN